MLEHLTIGRGLDGVQRNSSLADAARTQLRSKVFDLVSAAFKVVERRGCAVEDVVVWLDKNGDARAMTRAEAAAYMADQAPLARYVALLQQPATGWFWFLSFAGEDVALYDVYLDLPAA